MAKRALWGGAGAGPLKRARLDVTYSDHNFPLSQNRARPPDAQSPADEWGDDNDDEILLLASQACEEVTDRDMSALPDYSAWIQAPSTSTQQLEPSFANQQDIYGPSTSKNTKHFALKDSNSMQNGVATNFMNPPGTSRSTLNYQNLQSKSGINPNFEFKKPFAGLVAGATSTEILKDRRNWIASPLPDTAGNSMKHKIEEQMDLIHSEKDTEYFYNKLLQIQEENAKLKSENGKLQEKCLTKDGEVSILRTQLKTSQVAIDNARLDRLRANEKMQMEWTEKLDNINKEVRNLKTQLDFKNLEVVSMKDRCRNLESSKVKMTQVTVPGHDRSILSQRQTNNNTFSIQEEFNKKYNAPVKKCSLASANVQTDNRRNFMKLNPSYRSDNTALSRILPLLLQPARVQRSSLELDNKLQMDTQSKCRTFNAIHRIETGRAGDRVGKKERLSIESLYEDLSYLAGLKHGRFTEEGPLRKCFNVAVCVKLFLIEVLGQLENISQKVTSTFLRDMDEKYMQESALYTTVERDHLHSATLLFKEEQAIPARRAAAALATLCTCCDPLIEYIISAETREPASSNGDTGLISLMRKIVSHIAEASCAIQYSGLLLSFIYLIQSLLYKSNDIVFPQLSSLVKEIIVARPNPAVVCSTWSVLRCLSLKAEGLEMFCCSNSSGNLKLDFEQGLLLYKKESCFLQVLLKQFEIALKCIEREGQADSAVTVARNFIFFYRNADSLCQPWCQLNMNSKCYCSLLLAQVMVYLLQMCAAMLKCSFIKLPKGESTKEELLSICRCGIAILYLWTLRDSEFNTLLSFYEGHYHRFVELCEQMKEDITLNEIQGSTLAELVATLQLNMDDIETASPTLTSLWEDSFSRFTLVD